MRATEACDVIADPSAPATYAAVKKVFRNWPPAVVITSSEPESTLANWLDGYTSCEKYDNTMKMTPDAMVAIMIARGTVRLGSLASSESVDTASNPRNDRHRIAAPATIGLNPGAVPSPRSGAMKSTAPDWVSVTQARMRKTTMKIACTAMMTKLARSTDTMPMMLSTVTIAMV